MASHKFSIMLLVSGLLSAGAVVAAAADGSSGFGGGSSAFSDGKPVEGRMEVEGFGFQDGRMTPNSSQRALKELHMQRAKASAGSASAQVAAAQPHWLAERAKAIDKTYPRAKYVAAASVALLTATEVSGRTHLVSGLTGLVKGAGSSVSSAFSALSAGGDKAHIRMTPPSGSSRR